MIIIKSKWENREAKLAQLDKHQVCDKNNFAFIKFEGKEVKAGDSEKLTKYLVEQAVKKGATEVKK